MAGVEDFRCDFRDALNGSDDFFTDRVITIQQLQQTVVVGSTGVVLPHMNFLPDDALFLSDRLLGEIRRGDKMKQKTQVLFEQPRAVKIIRRHIGRGKRIGIGTVLRQKRQSIVSVRQVEHLMLQIMGHTGGGIIGNTVERKPAVSPAVVGREDRIETRKAFLGENTDSQTVLRASAE